MALANYSDLKQAIKDWLDRPDLDSYTADFVLIGENRIYRDLRVRAMETALSGTISSGVVAVPSDYIELKSAYVNRTPTNKLERASVEFIYDQFPLRSADGVPQYIAREAGNFIFGPYPDDSYSILGVYYKRLTALSDSNTTNWFTTNAPELLLYSSLCGAEMFLGEDERLPFWQAKYQEIKQRIQEEDDIETYSGSGLRMKAM